ncbi:MAG: hypothetical protein R2751_11535 [Bacteroidales bacterium]
MFFRWTAAWWPSRTTKEKSTYRNLGNGVYDVPPLLLPWRAGQILRHSGRHARRGKLPVGVRHPVCLSPVDSLYFMQRNSGEEDPDIVYHGLQFFNDVKGHTGTARNYLWVATESWEYHSPYVPAFMWHMGVVQAFDKDTMSTCYSTETIQKVYAGLTRFLTENSIYQNKPHYVSDQSVRLSARYSVLVRQHSLSGAGLCLLGPAEQQNPPAAPVFMRPNPLPFRATCTGRIRAAGPGVLLRHTRFHKTHLCGTR